MFLLGTAPSLLSSQILRTSRSFGFSRPLSFTTSPSLLSAQKAHSSTSSPKTTNQEFGYDRFVDTSKEWDAIIVGGGHNGLVCAAYLGKKGKRVLVLEKRDIIGGAAVTEEIIPGFRFSRCSYLLSLFRESIIKDLKLQLPLLHRNPSSFTPLRDGRYLSLGDDRAQNLAEISKFSKADAAVYEQYEAMLTEFSRDIVDPLLDQKPLLPAEGINLALVKQMLQMKKVGQERLLRFWELLTTPAQQILDTWFESEPLKSTLATDAIIGAMTSPYEPGSAYVLLHHVMGGIRELEGRWAYVEGGMGTVTKKLGEKVIEYGGVIQTGASVSRIEVDDVHAKVKGVVLESGHKIASKCVISNATPHITFNDLLKDSSRLSKSLRERMKAFDYTSPVTKINIALKKLPKMTCIENDYEMDKDRIPPPYRATLHFCESSEQIQKGYEDAKRGRCSTRPIIEMTIPSVLDNTLCKPGNHVAGLFVQYTPFSPVDGSWSDPAFREEFANRVFGVIEEYMPDFTSQIEGYELLAPPDLQRIFSLTGGNIFHGSMNMGQLYHMRPALECSDYRTPIQGLYLCGAGTHPGGGVMGAPGRNCSHIVSHDLNHYIV